jgi:5-(aminomethyl)-3-furanmethanol phosphate kinase
MSDPAPVVVKLGGSLHGDASLARWLGALQADRSARYVIVPGGGPFADQVRRSQSECGFDDATAHRMALLAMNQFGLLLCGLDPAAVPCDDPAQFRQAWSREQLPVWLPSPLLEGRDDLARDWSVTSDSIAAWLTHRIGARGLLLVKSCTVPAYRTTSTGDFLTGELAASGIVDAAFPKMMIGKDFPVVAMHRDDNDQLATVARQLQRPQRRV